MECFNSLWSRRLSEGDTSTPWIFGGEKSSLPLPSISKDPLLNAADSNYFQEIIENNMENDLREILREKAEKHREYYTSIVGTDNTDKVNSTIERVMGPEVYPTYENENEDNLSTPNESALAVLNMNEDIDFSVSVPDSGSTGSEERKTRTRRRGVYEIQGMISEPTEFKSVKVLRENYLAMLEKTTKQLKENSDRDEMPLKNSEILMEKSENESQNTENLETLVEKLEILTEKSELLVPPSSGYASGASDDEREKNWKNAGRRSGSSDSAVHSDEEGPIASNWGEKKEEILPNDGYQPRSPYSPRCSVDHSNVPSRTIIEAHYVPLPIDRKFSVDIVSEHTFDTFDESRRQSCFSEGEDQPRYRYWRTPSVVVSDYSDDIMGLTLEDIEYIRSRRENSISPDSSLHSSCSNLNYCGSTLSGLDGDYVLCQPYRKSSNCSTCSTLSDEEDGGDTLQPKKEVSN